MKFLPCLSVLLVAASSLFAADVTFDSTTVVVAASAGTVERNAAALLADRLHEQTGVPVELVREGSAGLPERGLVILIGVPGAAGLLRTFLDEHQVALPTPKDPGPEGFVIKSAASGPRVLVGAAATDERGTLYAAGEVLRRVVARGNGFLFPENLHLRTAPAFRIRGTEVSQGDTIRELTHSRRWTDEEWRHAVLDYALAGANTFGGGGKEFTFLKSYGLMVHGGAMPNSLPGHPEWAAVEPIGRLNFVCLSIPEARRAVLEITARHSRNQTVKAFPGFI